MMFFTQNTIILSVIAIFSLAQVSPTPLNSITELNGTIQYFLFFFYTILHNLIKKPLIFIPIHCIEF